MIAAIPDYHHFARGKLAPTTEHVASDVPPRSRIFLRRLVAFRSLTGRPHANSTSGSPTKLYLAAQHIREQEVRTLLAKGAKVDARAPCGETTLILAAQDSHVEVVDSLLATTTSPTMDEVSSAPCPVGARGTGCEKQRECRPELAKPCKEMKMQENSPDWFASRARYGSVRVRKDGEL